MHTVMAMIEAKLNNGPITHVNPTDTSVCLIRPIDFLSQRLTFILALEDNENYYDPDYDYTTINT
uniref:Uncharacterized protein n=1 Tax=Heterorhabditis bacteriophora TaxID=37862 RepID=A0A1I7WGF2_HETBA